VTDVGRDAAFTHEALRLCDRYVNEIVLEFGLCPWAEPALRAGRVGRAVCLAVAPTPDDCLPFLNAFDFASDPQQDIGLLLFPRMDVSWAAFDAFAERVRRADRQRWMATSSGAAPPFLIAAFHPDGVATFANPHQQVSYLRRTPDPMLQFVRAQIIDRVKATQPDASQNVAQHTFDRLTTREATRFDAVVREIRVDRDATYARLSSGANAP
jgi:hypothetical protein